MYNSNDEDKEEYDIVYLKLIVIYYWYIVVGWNFVFINCLCIFYKMILMFIMLLKEMYNVCVC